MQKFQKKDWIILGLTLLNVGLLAFFWFAPQPPSGKRDLDRSVGDRMVEILGLDEEQERTFKELRQTYFTESRTLHRQIRDNNRIMLRTLKETPKDTTALNALARINADHHYQLDQLLMNHYRDLQTVCSPEQLDKLHGLFIRSLQPPGAHRRQREKSDK